jgi:hypothetical protein
MRHLASGAMLDVIGRIAGVKMHSLCGHGGRKQQQASYDQPASGWPGLREISVLGFH